MNSPNTPGDPTVSSPNRRPENVERLLVEGETHTHWFAANRKINRFFVTNLKEVVGHVGVEHTTAKTYFDDAKKVIKDQTKWYQQHPFEYESSHAQIYPNMVREKKRFGHAATIIVALELAAAEKRPDFNVYDYLRILPVQYFVDGFDESAHRQLIDAFSKLDPETRQAKFGKDGSFDEICLFEIDQAQSKNLLAEMVSGHCITKYTARKFVDFVSTQFPEIPIGPVRSAGEESENDRLGTKTPAPSLRVKRTWEIKELPPCF